MVGVAKKLYALEAKRAALGKQVADAQAKLNDQIKARAELMEKIRDKLSDGADLTSLQGRTPAQLQKNLSKRLDALKQFQTDLATLKAKGLSVDSISELAQAGVDSAGGLAGALAKADSSQIQQINQMQTEIRKIAGDTGNSVAGSMYDAGIKAAQGLIKGLQSQQAAITKQMQSLANALVAAIRKALGIKSPSRVFMGLGVNTAQGYIVGYRKEMRKAQSMHSEMLALSGSGNPARVVFGNSPGSAFTPTSGSPGPRPPINITVNTQEIDPRKNAAELGWELEGRLR